MGIVSVRLGTVLRVTFPHDWQTSSATADMSKRSTRVSSENVVVHPLRVLYRVKVVQRGAGVRTLG